MSKAAKAVVAVVVVAGVAWAGTSWYMGKRVEDEVRAYIDKVNAQPSLVTMSIAEYNRGLFTSQVKYNVTARATLVPEVIEEGDFLALDSEVQHGPFPFARLGRGEFAPVLAASESVLQNTGLAIQWFVAAKGEQPLRERSSISFGGDVDSRMDFQPLSLTRDDVTMSSQAAWLAVRSNSDMTAFQMSGEFPDFRMQGSAGLSGDKMALRVQNTTFEGESRLGRFGAYIGNARFAMGNMSMEQMDGGPGSTSVVFNDYIIETQADEDDTNLSLRVNYGIGNMRVMDVDLGALQVALRLGSLNGEAIRGIVKRYEGVMPQIMVESATSDPQADLPVTEAFLKEAIEALLPGNPVVALDPVRLTVPGGESSLRVNLTAQQPAEPDPQDPLAYLRSLDGSLVVSRGMVIDLAKRFMTLQAAAMGMPASDPDAMAEESYAFVRQMALSSGYVVEEGENLVARVSYADGQARLNGDNVELAELFGPAFGGASMGDMPQEDDDAFLNELDQDSTIIIPSPAPVQP